MNYNVIIFVKNLDDIIGTLKNLHEKNHIDIEFLEKYYFEQVLIVKDWLCVMSNPSILVKWKYLNSINLKPKFQWCHYRSTISQLIDKSSMSSIKKYVTVYVYLSNILS